MFSSSATMTVSNIHINHIFQYLADHHIDSGDLLIALIQDPHQSGILASNASVILDKLIDQVSTRGVVIDWARNFTERAYVSEVVHLARKDSGFHFLASKATEEKLKEAEISEMAESMQTIAPSLWALFEQLLSADAKINDRRMRRRKATKGDKRMPPGADVEMEDATRREDEEDYSRFFETDMADLFDQADDIPEDAESQVEERFDALAKIVSD